MAHDVFISYSTKDQALAGEICQALEAASIRCWMAPRDVHKGKVWAEEITTAIESARVFFLLLTHSANQSQNVFNEVSIAADTRIPILYLRVDQVTLSKGLKYHLSAVQWMEAVSTSFQSQSPELVEP